MVTKPVYKCYKTVADKNGFPIGIPSYVTEEEFFRLFGQKPILPPVGSKVVVSV